MRYDDGATDLKGWRIYLQKIEKHIWKSRKLSCHAWRYWDSTGMQKLAHSPLSWTLRRTLSTLQNANVWKSSLHCLIPFRSASTIYNQNNEFPAELKKICQAWFYGLPELTGVRVPRYYHVGGKSVVETTIDTMTDALQLACPAIRYVRNEY